MIERSISAGILTLRLAHGKANALDVELLERLLIELDGASDDVRAVVLTGSGSIFSAGVDLFRLTNENVDYATRFVPLLSRFLRTLFAYPRPVVAAVNGHAIAGGCIITLASDIRLMADGKGTIGIPELLVGVPFPTAAIEIVRFAVPIRAQQPLIYLCRNLSPGEAVQAGLIDEVVDPEQLSTRANETARQLAAVPAEAFRLTKLALRAETLQRIDRAGDAHDKEALKVWTAPETRAHVREYLQRTVRRK